MLSAIFEIVHKGNVQIGLELFLDIFLGVADAGEVGDGDVKQIAKIIVPKNIKSLKILPSDTKESNPLSKILKNGVVIAESKYFIFLNQFQLCINSTGLFQP